MIKYVPHDLIDREQYDRCISQAINARIYARSWYLDAVSDNWDVLMSDSYRKVMPLPCRKKFGINYVYLPPWIQQLGVFSKDVITEEEVILFINSIPGKFVLVDYMLNVSNPVNKTSFEERINYTLPLYGGFEDILKKFNKNRQRISKRSFKEFRLEKNGKSQDFLKLIEGDFIKYPMSKDALISVNNLMQTGKPHIHIWMLYKEENCVGGLLWLKEKRRITYLLPVIKEEAKMEHVNTFLINQLIDDHQHNDMVLDFEGSMIPGVARFYKSFGARRESYHMYKKRLISHV